MTLPGKFASLSLPLKLIVISAIAVIIIGAAYATSLALNPSEQNLPDNSPNPTTSGSSPIASMTPAPTQHNESAIYTFTVKPTMVSNVFNTTNTRGEVDTTSYTLNIQITWDANQAPYVRYYEITPHFNGNSLPTQEILGSSGTDFRAWNSTYRGRSPWVENDVYYLGSGALTYPNPRNFLGIFQNYGSWVQQGIHGWVIGSITTEYDWAIKDWNASASDLQQTEKAINDFATSYFEGWTFTVKPVS